MCICVYEYFNLVGHENNVIIILNSIKTVNACVLLLYWTKKPRFPILQQSWWVAILIVCGLKLKRFYFTQDDGNVNPIDRVTTLPVIVDKKAFIQQTVSAQSERITDILNGYKQSLLFPRQTVKSFLVFFIEIVQIYTRFKTYLSDKLRP